MKLNPKNVAIVGGLTRRSYVALFGRHSPVRREMRACGLEHRLAEPPPAAIDATLQAGVDRAVMEAGRIDRAKRMLARAEVALNAGSGGASLGQTNVECGGVGDAA